MQPASASPDPIASHQDVLPTQSSGLASELASIKAATLAQQQKIDAALGGVDLKKTMGEMADCLKTLKAETLKGVFVLNVPFYVLMIYIDEIPYPMRLYNDESAWSAVYKATKKQTTERLEAIRNAMNYTLVFVGVCFIYFR